MTTQWYYPQTIAQYAEVEQHVSWTGEENNYVYLRNADLSYISTTKELLHIANPTTHDLVMKTAYLYLTDFRLAGLPDVISGVQLEVNMRRGGRITDETIQLRYNDEFIGRNSANMPLNDVTLYGSETDLWELDNLTPSILSDPSFGVGIRYQSHPAWPHREHPMINYIRLRVS